MEAILQWGLDCIRAVQSPANPSLALFMKGITQLGSAAAYMLLLPLVYWCIDEKRGIRLGLAMLVSAWVNVSLKLFLDQPRPFFKQYDPSVGMIPERLGGFPSGHAQNSLVIWGIIASWGKRKWLYGIAALLCLLIGFSRIYLGVHFPTDILGGWVLGGMILCAWFFLNTASMQRRFEALVAKGGFRAELICAALAAFIMILYRPHEEVLIFAGMFFGAGTGYSINRRFIGFKSSGICGRTGVAKYLTLLARFVLGMITTFLILTALGKIIPANRLSGYYQMLYFFRFIITALWAYAGAPWLFCLLRLAEGKKENA